MKIQDISKIDMPREKLERYGVEKLHNADLLAIILGTGRKGENVLELSRRILRLFPPEKFLNLTLSEIKKIKGVGISKASQIIACFELGKRFLKGKATILLLSPREVWDEMKEIRDNKKEHFAVFFLNVRNQIIKKEIISIGTLNTSLVHPREVFEPAIRYSTAQIIISHNHPSEDSTPSEEDILITRKLAQAGKILGIEILDHVIVTKKDFFSMKEKGMIGIQETEK